MARIINSLIARGRRNFKKVGDVYKTEAGGFFFSKRDGKWVREINDHTKPEGFRTEPISPAVQVHLEYLLNSTTHIPSFPDGEVPF